MDEGQNLARAIITLVSFAAFIGIVIWAYSGRRKKDFDEAANLPFEDDDVQRATLGAERGESTDERADRPGGQRRDDELPVRRPSRTEHKQNAASAEETR